MCVLYTCVFFILLLRWLSFLLPCYSPEVQGPLQRLAPIISHMKQLDLQEMLEETPSEQADGCFEKKRQCVYCTLIS